MSTVTLDQVQRVIKLIEDKKLTEEDMDQIFSSGLLADLFEANIKRIDRDNFRSFCGLPEILPDVIELTDITIPDRSVSFNERIAQGCYNWVSEDITEKLFPLTLPKGIRKLVLASFTKRMKTKAIEQWAITHGYTLALIDDLLAVCSHPDYKELQKKFSVMQLGSLAELNGINRPVFLPFSRAGRTLELGYHAGGGWGSGNRFLLCRK